MARLWLFLADGKVLSSISCPPDALPARCLCVLLELLKTLLEKLSRWIECPSYPSFHFAIDQNNDLGSGTLLKIPQVHTHGSYSTLWCFGYINMVTIPSVSWQMKQKPECQKKREIQILHLCFERMGLKISLQNCTRSVFCWDADMYTRLHLRRVVCFLDFLSVSLFHVQKKGGHEICNVFLPLLPYFMCCFPLLFF